jgi:hypothetical protein
MMVKARCRLGKSSCCHKESREEYTTVLVLIIGNNQPIWKAIGEVGAKLPLNAAVKDGSCKQKVPKCCRYDGCNAVDEPEGGWWVNTEEDKSPDNATGELPARPESVRWLLQPRQDEEVDDIESHRATFGIHIKSTGTIQAFSNKLNLGAALFHVFAHQRVLILGL